MPPRRSTRSATVEPEPKPNSTAVKRKRSQAPADGTSAKETKPSRLSIGPSSKGRTLTRPRASLKEVEESDDEEDEEDVLADSLPVKKSRPSPEIEDSEDDDAYAEEEYVIKPKGRKSISARKGKGKASDDGDGEKSGSNTSAALTQDEEIEESLLDPAPPPLSQIQSLSQSLPRPEEPTGPKSRLTIHKMALVNFKSYAGRQEIGPFHKVRLYTIFN
jgi:structural maintenance of chromosome 4